MAMASLLQKGQAPVCCNLCQTEKKITWKCLPCNLLMCTKCKDNVHSKIKTADEHKIIDIKDVGLYSEDVDFSYIKCLDHVGQTCVMFCQSCDQLVCTQCISKVHNGHGLVEISESYQIKVEKLKELQTGAMVKIDDLTDAENNLDSIRNAVQDKLSDTKKVLQAQNEALKKAVDIHTDNITKELDNRLEPIQKSIETCLNIIKPVKQNLNDQLFRIEDLMKSKNAGKVFHEINQLSQSVNSEHKILWDLEIKTLPKFLPGEITECNVGTVEEEPLSPLNISMTISKEFITEINKVITLSTCSDGTLWISDGHVVQKVKPEEDNLKVLSSYKIENRDMAVIPSNDLLLASGSKLKQISGKTGKMKDSLYSVDPLKITAVHVTKDLQILVGAKKKGDAIDGRVVIRMNTDGTHEKTYEHDGNKQPIFTDVYQITTTTKGRIFVLDKLSEDGKGRVVVLGQDGDVINTYTGHPRINRDDKPFKPVGVVTTPFDNIIVSDKNVHTLHILNFLGHHITHYNTKSIGIPFPFSLSFTSSGQLYIGCTIPKGSKDNSKVFEVDMHESNV